MIVVIGILAAISIVAYAGISQSARDSSAKASAKQLATKLETTYIQEGSYPAALSDIGIRTTDTTSYQYTSSNTTTPSSWCSTVTVGSTSYYVSSTTSTPTKGGCPGHGQGGVEAITNYFRNPLGASTSGFNAATVAGQVSTLSTNSTGGPTGGSFIRKAYTASTTAFGSGADIFMNGGSTWSGVSAGGVVAASPGQVFSGSAYVRSSKAQRVKLQLQWLNSGAGGSGVHNSDSITLQPNTWTRLTVSGAAPTETVSVRLDLDGGSSPVQWASGDTIDITMLMVTEGDTIYNYADGNSTNWVWNGTANASTSTGPAL